MASVTVRSPVPDGGLMPPPSPALPLRGRGLRYPASRWVAVPAVTGAAVLGVACTLRPLLAAVLVVLAVLVAAVWVRPALAACLLIFLTPLTAGIDRGSALPVLRPQEALAVVLGGTLAVRGVVRMRTGQLPRFRLGPVEWALVLMAVAGSLLPLLRMAVRQEAIGQDDVLYALVLWKYLGLYVLIRASVSTDRHVRACLWLSVAASTVVAGLAILQSLGLFGVPHLLATYYAPFGYTDAFAARGSSTLGLPAATADLAVINLAIVAGLWTRFRRYRPALAVATAVLVMGALSAGEFSSAIGLLAGVFCIAIVIRRPRLLWTVGPAALVAGYALWPVISRRLSGFESASGLPVSWTGRLVNLQTYFWPKLFSGGNFLLGVRPAARIPVATQATGFVWIESGYTWLLWAGGIPLLAGFVFLACAAARRGWRAARSGMDGLGGAVGPGTSVAGIGLFTAIVVICVLMTFDPHLTYRGTGDAFFTLLALAAPRAARAAARAAPRAPLTTPTAPATPSAPPAMPSAPPATSSAAPAEPRPGPTAPLAGRPSENHGTRAAAPAPRRTPPAPGATQHDPAIREVGQ